MIFLFLLLLSAGESRADTESPIFVGARAQSMGGAFTAIADDEQAIFYNSAGLAGLDHPSYHFLAAGITASDHLLANYGDLKNAFLNPGVSSLDVLQGKSLYGRGTAYMTFSTRRFGIALFGDELAISRINNPNLPTLYFGAQTTYGGQFGFGLSVMKFNKKKGEIRIGIAGKFLMRGGGFKNYTLTQYLALDTATLTSTYTNLGSGMGVDVGMQILFTPKKNFDLLGGLNLKDIGDTAFSAGVASQHQQLDLGTGLRFRSRDMVGTLAFDYKNVFGSVDWRNKVHLGFEMKFPVISLYSGLYQSYFTYGAAVDLGITRVNFTSYSENVSDANGVYPERHYMLRATMKFDIR